MFNSFHLTLLSLNVKTDAGIQTSSVDSNPAYFDLIGAKASQPKNVTFKSFCHPEKQSAT